VLLCLVLVILALAIWPMKARAAGADSRPAVAALAGLIVERYRELDRDFDRCLHPDRSRWSLAFLGFVPNNPHVTRTEARALTALVREAILEANLGFPLFAVDMNREIARLARTSVETEAFRRQLAEQESATFVLAVHPMRPSADTVVLDINLLARNAGGVYFCNRPITLAVHLPTRTVREDFPPSGELYTLDGAVSRFVERYARELLDEERIGLGAASDLVGDCDLARNVETRFATIYSEVADVLAFEELVRRRLPHIDAAAGEDDLLFRVRLLSQRGDRVVRVGLGLWRGTRRLGTDLFAAVVDPADLSGCDPAIAEMREEISVLRAARDALDEEVEALADRGARLREEAAALTTALGADEAARETLAAEILRLTGEREAAEQAARAAEADAVAAGRALDAVRAELADVEAALETLRAERERLGQDVAADRAEREALRAELRELEDRIDEMRAQEAAGREVLAELVEEARRARFRDHSVFRECAVCPEMVVIPAGSFRMGSPVDEEGRDPDEGPQHRRDIGRFALGLTEVTVGEFRRFVNETGWAIDGGCWGPREGRFAYHDEISWERPGFLAPDTNPVACVGFDDARAYVDWVNGKVERAPYRLPSEAEWEYAARAGADGAPFFWGASAGNACAFANAADLSAKRFFPGWSVLECEDGYGSASPVGSFRPNAYGLFDMAGNVWELTEDCWHALYRGAPSDGRPRREEDGGNCAARVVRGGAWDGMPRNLRVAERLANEVANRSVFVGFRLARTLPAP